MLMNALAQYLYFIFPKSCLHCKSSFSDIYKTMTIEKIHRFDIDNKDIEIDKDFACLGSVINSNGECNQEIKRELRLRRAAMKNADNYN